MTPPLARRNLAHGNKDRQSEMVVESQAEQLILEAKLVLARAQPLLITEPRQRGKEQILE